MSPAEYVTASLERSAVKCLPQWEVISLILRQRHKNGAKKPPCLVRHKKGHARILFHAYVAMASIRKEDLRVINVS